MRKNMRWLKCRQRLVTTEPSPGKRRTCWFPRSSTEVHDDPSMERKEGFTGKWTKSKRNHWQQSEIINPAILTESLFWSSVRTTDGLATESWKASERNSGVNVALRCRWVGAHLCPLKRVLRTDFWSSAQNHATPEGVLWLFIVFNVLGTDGIRRYCTATRDVLLWNQRRCLWYSWWFNMYHDAGHGHLRPLSVSRTSCSNKCDPSHISLDLSHIWRTAYSVYVSSYSLSVTWGEGGSDHVSMRTQYTTL